MKRDLSVARNTNLNNLHVAGNLDVSGTIRAAQFLPGQVVNMVVLSNIELNQTDTIIVTGQTTDTVFSYTYTPVIANSYLLIEYQSNYSLGGNGNEIVEAYIYINNNMICKTTQRWLDEFGGGTRSRTIFPILGRYTNSDITSKQIRVDINANNTDDDVDVYSDISTWLKITEIGR